MQITDIKVHQPVGLLRLLTDTELEGWCLGVSAEVAGHIQSSCREVLVGRDPLDRERHWQELVHLDRFRYLPHTVRGFVDVALWDLAGKAVDLPVWRLLGGFRDRIPAYKSGGNLEDVTAFVRDAVQARDEGFSGYKDHCYRGPEVMGAVARQARAEVGPGFRLMHDAVQTYTYPEALRVGRVLEEQEYFWFEEPLRDYDLMGLKRLSDALDVPIAATEYLPGTIYSTAQVLAQQAVDIVRASVPWRGGITDMVKIARLAEAFGVNCEITSVGAMHGFVHAHVLAAIRNCTFFETWQLGSLGGEPLIRNPLEVRDGHVSVPCGPGLGVQLDWGQVERQTQSVI
ncbi:MAG: enolase C-terminal domain-like protein [Candidatus Latescibacterota bacterium]|jgi:L-alanine-DL-glutamate epimerase-like enolase superfamily enzyme